jgi:hypothetical protein
MNTKNNLKSSEGEVVDEPKITLTMTALEAAQLGILATVGSRTIVEEVLSATHQRAVVDSIGTLERLSLLVATEYSRGAGRKH